VAAVRSARHTLQPQHWLCCVLSDICVLQHFHTSPLGTQDSAYLTARAGKGRGPCCGDSARSSPSAPAPCPWAAGSPARGDSSPVGRTPARPPQMQSWDVRGIEGHSALCHSVQNITTWSASPGRSGCNPAGGCSMGRRGREAVRGGGARAVRRAGAHHAVLLDDVQRQVLARHKHLRRQHSPLALSFPARTAAHAPHAPGPSPAPICKLCSHLCMPCGPEQRRQAIDSKAAWG